MPVKSPAMEKIPHAGDFTPAKSRQWKAGLTKINFVDRPLFTHILHETYLGIFISDEEKS